jgi:hypothetical protein
MGLRPSLLDKQAKKNENQEQKVISLRHKFKMIYFRSIFWFFRPFPENCNAGCLAYVTIFRKNDEEPILGFFTTFQELPLAIPLALSF